MTKIHNVQQRTPEWSELRLGKLTGSQLKSIIDMRTLKLKSKDALITAASKMIAELETGFSNDSDFQTDSMAWGIEQEQEYKDEMLYKDGFEDIGFATNDKYKYLGCSPDAIHESGKLGVEIKCPNSANHIKICIKKEIPSEYWPQLFCYFLVFEELERLQFISYDSRNEKRPSFKVIVKRSDIADKLEKVHSAVIEFETFVNSLL